MDETDGFLQQNGAMNHTDQESLQQLSPYLNGKRQELVNSLAVLKKDRQIAVQAKQMVPVVEDKIREITQWYQEVCRRRKAELAETAKLESVQAAVTLDPLDNAPGSWRDSKQGAWTLMGTAGVGSIAASIGGVWALGLPAMLIAPVALAGIALMYRQYLFKARAIYADRKTIAPHRHLDAIEQYEIVMMQFAPGKTANFTYNYNCTFVSVGHEKDIMQIWKLNPDKYGNLYGATFVGFRDTTEEGQIALLIKLDDASHKLECIELRAGFLNNLRYVKKDFLVYLAKESEVLVKAITPLTAAISQYDGKSKLEVETGEKLDELDQQIGHVQKIGAEPAVLDEMLLQIDLFRSGGPMAPRGMLLYGPSGTGKTKIGVTIAQATRCGYLKVDVADLKTGGKGTVAEKVKKLWRRAFLLAPCILFLDDCDGVFGNGVESFDKNSTEREFVDTFLSEWDTYQETPGKVMVLGATNRREAIEMSVLLRFNQTLEIGIPSELVRRRILIQEFVQAGIPSPVTAGMVKATAGMAGRELQQLAMRMKGLSHGQEFGDGVFADALKSIRTKASTLTESVAWKDVILPDSIKSKLQYLTKKIQQSEEYAKAGLPVSKSLLLYGPPGTGKTQIARALATESGLSFMAVTTADIKKTKTGESSKLVQILFERARSQSPCLLFIDEIDIVTAARTSDDQIGQEIVGQFLQEMDGINSRSNAGQVFVIGATNHKEQIDAAVLSRFSDQEEIALPTLKGRADIVALNLQKKPLAFNIRGVSLRVAQVTEGFSGRDLYALVNSAASNAMQRADQLQLDIKDIRIEESDFENISIGGRVVTLADD